MTPSTTLSVRLSSRTKNKLGRLARATKRTKSFLAGEAIEAFVARELEIIEDIKKGLADVKAGRVIPHDEVVRRTRETISRILQEKQ
ncbi:MAG: CopG family transcriptional regulator [Hyphomicrobiaceae bacterium]|nr:MAG: CopG family transcriptional regulator [Hyphomicrobiaceae bacterium]